MMDGYLTMRQLRGRGWNDRLVRDYLGEADDHFLPDGPSPGRPQRLYLLARVLEIETRHPEFVVDQARRATLAERTRRATEVKMRQFQDVIDAVDLPSFHESYVDLVARARRRTESLVCDVGDERLALDLLLDSLKSVLESTLSLYSWHPGIRDARSILKQRVLAHVVTYYPALANVAQIEMSNSDLGRGTNKET